MGRCPPGLPTMHIALEPQTPRVVVGARRTCRWTGRDGIRRGPRFAIGPAFSRKRRNAGTRCRDTCAPGGRSLYSAVEQRSRAVPRASRYKTRRSTRRSAPSPIDAPGVDHSATGRGSSRSTNATRRDEQCSDARGARDAPPDIRRPVGNPRNQARNRRAVVDAAFRHEYRRSTPAAIRPRCRRRAPSGPGRQADTINRTACRSAKRVDRAARRTR